MSQEEKSKDSNKKDGLDVQLESSFQSSFRSTSTHLKVYDPATGAEAPALGASDPRGNAAGRPAVGGAAGGAELQNENFQNNQNLTKQNARGRIQLEPPAGWHAPHHSWLLGSHGGKKKPQAVRTRDGISTKSAIDSATLAGLFSAGAAGVASSGPASTAPNAPQSAPPASMAGSAQPVNALSGQPTPIGEHPDDYRMPANAKGALPPESYEQADLYSPTVEVSFPAAQGGAKSEQSPNPNAQEDFDETVAHLYSRTVDVNKPGKLTRFPEDSLSLSNDDRSSLDAPKFGTTSPPGNIPTEAAPPVVQAPTQGSPFGTPASPPLVPGSQPPRLPPARPLSQFQSGISHPAFPPKLPPNLPIPNPIAPAQFQSGHANPVVKPPVENSESNQAEWSPHFGSAPSQPAEPDSLESGKYQTVKKSSPAAPATGKNLSPEDPPGRTPRRTSRTSKPKDEIDTEDDSNTRGPRKRGLPSYMDRQIGSGDVQDSDEDDSDGYDGTHKKGSAGKTIGIAVAAIIALAAVGAVAYQGINSGGSSWIPFVGSNEWKEWNTKAETSMSEGKYEEAIESLNHAIKLNSGQAALYHRRGLAKLQLHKRDQNESALRDLDLSLKQDPKLFEAMLDRAAVRIELGQFDQAIEDYDRLIKAGKDTDKVRYGRGLAKYYAGEYAEAEREFKNILKVNPDNAEAAIALGTTLYAGNADKSGAEEQFTNAAKNDKSGLADRNLGIISYRNGASGYQAAKEFYGHAIDENPNDASIYNERGVISWWLKNPLDATTDFRHAVGLDPGLESAVRNLEFVGKSSIDADPKSAVSLLRHIEINLLKKNYAFAILNADKLIEVAGWKKAPAYDGVLLKWVALNLSGEADKSTEVLRDCKINAGNFSWPMPLIKYLADDSKITDFSKLEAFNPTQRTSAHYYAGMNDYFSGNSDDAKKKLLWVIEQGSPSSLEYPLAGKALELLAEGSASSKVGGVK